MGLFSPWFLAGLAALGLPLWLHLLKQFKRSPRPFSSLMFFERRVQSSSKHRRLRYLRLLAARMALLALLALLFANPFITRSSISSTSKLTVVAIDRSFSMRAGNRLQNAKEQALQFVSGLGGRANMQILALDERTAALTQSRRDQTALVDAINGIQATDKASSFGEFSRALRVMEQSTGLGLDVHLFTDAQQTSMPPAFSDLAVGGRTSLTIHTAGPAQTPNWAIQSVIVPARTYDTASVKLTATVGGWQSKDAVRKVSVLLDGRSIASRDLSIPASGQAQLEFTNLVIPFGEHRGEVKIEPHDELSADDSFLFSIEHSDPRKVLFLYSLQNNAGFYYKSALDAAVASGLRVQVQSLQQASGMDFGNYAFVVLNDPGELDGQLTQQLRDYLAKGGALFIAAGPATQRAGAIPVTGQRVAATSNEQNAGAVESAAREIFDTGAFDNVRFYSPPQITAASTDRVLARFSDGSPLLLEQKQGTSHVLIFASALDTTGSDFPLHASFLPFVASTGAYLAGDTGSDVSSMVVGGAVMLRQSKSQTASADVVGPGGKHEISLSDAPRVMVFNPEREGFYEIHPAAGRRLLLAVHADRRESNLAQVPAETLNLWRNTGNGPAAQGGPVESTIPFSLWRYILALVLIAALVESIFASRYLSEERQAA